MIYKYTDQLVLFEIADRFCSIYHGIDTGDKASV